MHGLAESLAELVFPTRCAGCELPGALLCASCLDALALIDRGTACPRCGAPGGIDGCAECRDVDFAFEAARCAGPLALPLSRAITVYKDGGERRLASPLGSLLARAAGDWTGWADALVPVPPTRAARSRRGFDHTRRLADAFAHDTGVSAAAVLRATGRGDQRGLSRAERLAHAAHAFQVVADAADMPRRVLLLDDVCTTGATLDAAAHILCEAGVEEVRVVSLARAVGRVAQA